MLANAIDILSGTEIQLDTIGGQFDWLARENPYNLLAEHRAILVYKYWQESVNGACEVLTRMKAEYDTSLQDTEQIGERRKLAVLQKAKIIGMTTTGAAIHRNPGLENVDSFQGSESEIVIVSLVRSNEERNIGHLGMRNRMCVAASRARRGVYFVGNHATLAQKSDNCLEIERAKEKIRLQIRIEAIANKKKELQEEILKLNEKGNEGIVVKEVHPDDDTAQSYFVTKDRAEKYTQPDCNAMVVVTNVQRIENLKLQGIFLEAQKELFDLLEIPEWLFYGGSDDLLDQVVNKGFRAAHEKAHRFDVYSSSIAQNNENRNLLLCEVLLGKTWRLPSLESLDEEFDGSKLRQKSCDSVSLVGGQENEEESRPFEHVIFNLEQAIPRCMVSYKLVNLQALTEANEFERLEGHLGLEGLSICMDVAFNTTGAHEYPEKTLLETLLPI